MIDKKSSTVCATICLALALSTSTAVVTVPEPAQAFDLKKVQKQFKKNVRKTRKNINKTLRKNNIDKNIARGVAAGLIFGLATDSVAAGVIAGVVVSAAPEVFKRDLIRVHGKDMEWSASLSSRRQRVVINPQSNISSARQRELNARVIEDVKDIQRALAELGLYKKSIDGDFGPGSRAGVKEFQRSLNAAETGTLTAEQRHRLFIQAEQAGFVRQARAETSINDGVANTSHGQNNPVVNAIPEYRLAKSRFDALSADYLMAGTLSAVTSADMMPDGSVSVVLTDPSGSSKPMSIKPSAIYAEAHPLANEWARIYVKNGPGEKIVANTRDDFSSLEEATAWIDDVNKRVKRLSLLTGEANTMVAQGGTSQSPEETSPDGSLRAGEDGRIILAGKDLESGISEGLDTAPKTCKQEIYVSFGFPNGDLPVSHYNITPPDGTIMIDNGDSTAYFTGTCVLGEYAFSYVHIDKGNGSDEWKHIKREGKFEISQNSEQCSVDLNQPTGTAQLACF